MTKVRDADKLWIYRGVATQGNVAGGAIILDITPGAGNYLQLISARVNNSGTNTLGINIIDSANNVIMSQGGLGSAASQSLNIPTIGANTSASANTSNSVEVCVYGTDKFTFFQGAAGAQNDTMTVCVRAYCRSAPTVSKSRSTNEGSVTIAETYNSVIVP